MKETDPRYLLCKAPLFYGKELEGFSQGAHTLFVTDIRYLLSNTAHVESAILAANYADGSRRYTPYSGRVYLGAGELSAVCLSDLGELLDSEWFESVSTLAIEASISWYLDNFEKLEALIVDCNARSTSKSRTFEFVVTLCMVGSGGKRLCGYSHEPFDQMRNLERNFTACNAVFSYKTDACNLVSITRYPLLAGKPERKLSVVNKEYAADVDLTPYIDAMKQ